MIVPTAKSAAYLPRGEHGERSSKSGQQHERARRDREAEPGVPIPAQKVSDQPTELPGWKRLDQHAADAEARQEHDDRAPRDERHGQANESAGNRRAARSQNTKPNGEFTTVVDMMYRLLRSSESSRTRGGSDSAAGEGGRVRKERRPSPTWIGALKADDVCRRNPRLKAPITPE